MLPKENRLVKQNEIKKVLSTKVRFYKDSISVLARVTSENHFQLLIIVSKKIHKRAYVRNKIRRRLQALFETMRYHDRLSRNVALIILIKDKKILQENIQLQYGQYLSNTVEQLKHRFKII
jgi:ribonuclease P protein component